VRTARALSLLAALALVPSLAAAQSVPAAAAAPAPAAKKTPKRVSDINCERYLKLPDHARAMLIGWEAGQTFRKGAFAGWVVDADKVAGLVNAVEADCRVHLSASFWYTVKNELKKVK
jgi:hypothetical protein